MADDDTVSEWGRRHRLVPGQPDPARYWVNPLSDPGFGEDDPRELEWPYLSRKELAHQTLDSARLAVARAMEGIGFWVPSWDLKPPRQNLPQGGPGVRKRMVRWLSEPRDRGYVAVVGERRRDREHVRTGRRSLVAAGGLLFGLLCGVGFGLAGEAPTGAGFLLGWGVLLGLAVALLAWWNHVYFESEVLVVRIAPNDPNGSKDVPHRGGRLHADIRAGLAVSHNWNGKGGGGRDILEVAEAPSMKDVPAQLVHALSGAGRTPLASGA